ncbi:hypothetical protein SAMN05192583_0580 [Sphingomonas gellani]|uniref:Uncharacterized protein n=1 Tax=Sphingomonas gellani TaxID=1166340 RepID=A0A1H7Z8U2_9SPHN|nr:hypothetical protein [Sphingomonas gellani]SEM54651.1 hypothetical protein SAMN05192583_0580 [Sphingomonas gellani]
MPNYAARFNQQYLLSIGKVVATIVAAIGDDQPEVTAAMEEALGDLLETAQQFPTGNPAIEVQALRSCAGL